MALLSCFDISPQSQQYVMQLRRDWIDSGESAQAQHEHLDLKAGKAPLNGSVDPLILGYYLKMERSLLYEFALPL